MFTSGPRHALKVADPSPANHARIAFATVSAHAVVQGEVQNVVAAMRQNKHWQRSRRYKETADEDKLLRGFLELVDELAYVKNFEDEISPVKFVTPFLDVVSSVKTSGPITSVALGSVHKLLSWNLINENHPDAEKAIRLIAESVRHCRFEATNSEGDEVVLAKILETLLATVACPAGKFLSDNCVCEMIQNCFRISNQSTFTALLRRTAQRCLTDMVCVVFARLRELQPQMVQSAGPSPAQTPVVTSPTHTGQKESAVSHIGPYLRLPATRKRSIYARANRSLSFGPVPTEEIRAKEAANKYAADAQGRAMANATEELAQQQQHVVSSPLAAGPSGPTEATGEDGERVEHTIIDTLSKNKTIIETTHTGEEHPAEPEKTPTAEEEEGGKDNTTSESARADTTPSRSNVVLESVSGDVTDSSMLAVPKPAGAGDRRLSEDGVGSELDYEVVAGSNGAVRVAKDASQPPYGLQCMANTLAFIASLVEPKTSNSDQTRALALNLLLSILESVGDIIGECPPLVRIMQDQVSKYLYRGCLKDDIYLFSLSLRVVSDMYDTVRSHLKLQFQVFFSAVLLRIARSSELSLEQQEMAWDSIISYCCKPYFAVELYTNYDCDLQCRDLFELLVTFLSKSCFPTSGQLTDIHIRASQGLLAILHNIAERCVREEDKTPDEAQDHVRQASDALSGLNFHEDVDTELLRKRKETKGFLHQGALLFNKDPKKGIEYLQGVHLLPEPNTGKAVAEFFRTTPSIDKKVMGEFLGKMKDFNLEVLQAFFESFNLHHLTIDEALRIVLDHFRLPGEAQQISRILEHFAAQYYKQNNEVFADADAVFVLSFSVIMLNTDLHNDQVKKKMSIEDFIRNNRGINNKEDLPRELLTQLYDTILHDEIKMSDDSSENQSLEGLEVSNSRWSALLRHSPSVDAFHIAMASPHDHQMFTKIWGPAIAAISVVFDSTDNITVLEKARAGFMDCARIAAFYSLDEIFDNLVISVCKYTALLSPIIDRSVVLFGNKLRAQLAAQTAFQITRQFGDHLREGWRNILDFVLRAFKLDILPQHLMEMDHPTEERRIPIPCTPPQSAPKAKPSVGLFGGWFGGGAQPEEDETTSADADATTRATECIASCNIDEVLYEVRFIKAESLEYLVRALILAPGRIQTAPGAAPADPDEEAMIFCLELLVEIALRNRDRISLLWPMIHEHLKGICTSAQSPSLLVERAILGLIRLCTRLVHRDELSISLIQSLDVLLSPSPAIVAALYPAMHGLLNLIRTNANSIRLSSWQIVFSIIERCASHEKACQPAWAALEFLMVDKSFFSPVNVLPWSKAVRAFGASHVRGTKGSVDACDLLFTLFELLTSHLKTWGETMRDQVSFAQLENKPKLPVQLPLSTLEHATAIMDKISAERAAIKVSDDMKHEDKAWIQFCLPFVDLMVSLCRDPRPPVANYAVICLQRALLHSNVDALSPRVWKHCFEHIVFPLMTDIAESASKAGLGNDDERAQREETRLRVCALLSKAVLHRQTELLRLPDFHEVWVKVLGFLELYLRSSAGSEFLGEAVTESLKNIMMVLAASGGFVSEEDHMCGPLLWDLSFVIIDPFAPQVKEEVCLRLDRTLVPEGRYIDPNPPEPTPAPPAEGESQPAADAATVGEAAPETPASPAVAVPPTEPATTPASPAQPSTPVPADATAADGSSAPAPAVTVPARAAMSTPPGSPGMSSAPGTPTPGDPTVPLPRVGSPHTQVV